MPRLPNPSNLLAAAALFLALGGTTYAAAKIGGEDVRNNSLTGADIRNGSLSAREFRPGALQQRTAGPPGAAGERGAQGDQGPEGLPGATGPQGAQGEPGAAKGAWRLVRQQVPLPLEEAGIGLIRLPRGNWIVTVNGTVRNHGAATADASCELAVSPPVRADVQLSSTIQRVPLALSGAVVSSGEEPLELRCRATQEDIELEQLSIVAIQVAELSVMPGK